MTPIISVDHTGKWTRSAKLLPSEPAGVGRLYRALMLSLGCLMVHCSGSNAPAASGEIGGSGTGGATTSGVSASGGSNATGGSGGVSSVSSAGGTGGNSASASGGSTTPIDGSGGSKTGGTGGAVSKGGANGSGGAAAGGTTARDGGGSTRGGASNAGGATGTGGKAKTDGGPNAGGATGTGGDSNSGVGGSGGGAGGAFTVTSPGWTNMEGCSKDAKTSCSPVPTEMTRSGAGTSPELHWTGAPEGTKSFVVLLQDLNNGTAHWILWNIPGTATMLAANVDRTTATPATPAGSQQCGKGDEAATDNGYYGPGAPCNVYELVLYALSIPKFSPTNATEEQDVRTQLQALGSSILGTAILRGRTNQNCGN